MKKLSAPIYVIRKLGFKRTRQAAAIGLTAAWSFLIYRVLRWKADREGSRAAFPLRVPFRKHKEGDE